MKKKVFFRRIVLMLVVIAPAITALHAQSTGAADKLAKVMTDSLAYLSLTPQQTTDAMGLNTTAAKALVQTAQKAKTDTTFKGKALAQQVMGIMKQRNAGLKKMLTPDQMKLLQQHQLAQVADLQTKMMTAQLDLTDEQVPQVYQINLEATGEMMGNATKAKEAKGKLGKAKAGKAMKGDSKDKDEALKKVLSPDQYSKYLANKEAQQAAMKEKMQEKKAAK